ncbi:MAG: cytochrome c peroxidase [Bacteroidota bacterium]|nr:cytochrome c peroxidase [Bacteroidota bacterium]MDP4229437.1 cytochrome c peroxidase [Bacteroidota bacterium]MDP4236574.1 cytochrome c peroxidase [Bacteroidota bacterium]
MKNKRIPFFRLGGVILGVVASMTFLASCKDAGSNTQDQPLINTSIPKSPGAVVEPADNPSSAAKIELGRHLFYDKALSVDGSTSCGSCHQVANGFSDVTSTSIGFEHQHGNRNAPALANVAYNTAFTWDGRFASLEKHAPGPIFNSLEMGNNFTNDPKAQDSVPSGYNSKPGSNDTLMLFKRLSGRPGDLIGKTYGEMFTAAWGDSRVSMERIAKSIAAFERTLISTQSAFDKYNNGDASALKGNASALHGLQLFTDVNGANCISCHSGYNFTDQQFHDNGIGLGPKMNMQPPDKGRSDVSQNSQDDYKFKTPSLRNVALSGPYMHDGRFASLYDVLGSYRKGGAHTTPYQDDKIEKIGQMSLSDADVNDIVEFLKTLTDFKFADKSNQAFSNPWGD